MWPFEHKIINFGCNIFRLIKQYIENYKKINFKYFILVFLTNESFRYNNNWLVITILKELEYELVYRLTIRSIIQ